MYCNSYQSEYSLLYVDMHALLSIFPFFLTCLARVIHRSLSQLHKLEELDLGNNELYSLVRFFCFNPEECQKHNFSLCLVLVMSEQISIPRGQLQRMAICFQLWF